MMAGSASSVADTMDEDSFVVLGSTSPKTSLHNIMELSRSQTTFSSLDDDVRKLVDYFDDSNKPEEANGESSCHFKRHFEMDDPSPESMAAASNLVASSMSSHEMEMKIGDLVEENVLLRSMLQHNNTSMREQFQTIMSWQSGMVRAQQLHKDKFKDTQTLIEKLRADNFRLKKDLNNLKQERSAMDKSSLSSSYCKSVPCSLTEESRPKLNPGPLTEESRPKTEPSIVDFITEDDRLIIDNLAGQLEMVERERRQLKEQNDKLVWQKESLEKVVALCEKEIAELKEEQERSSENNKTEEKKFQEKIRQLQSELKSSQLKLLEAENLKLENIQYKDKTHKTIEQLKSDLMDLKTNLSEVNKIVLPPVTSVPDSEMNLDDVEFANYIENIKIYNDSMSKLADNLTLFNEQYSKLHKSTVNLCDEMPKQGDVSSPAKSQLEEVKKILKSQEYAVAEHKKQVSLSVAVLNKIFLDYQQVLKIGKNSEREKAAAEKSYNIVLASTDVMTAQLTQKSFEMEAKDKELGQLRKIIETLQKDSDERDHMRAQLDVYKSDFETERDARTAMAAEKDELAAHVRSLQKNLQDLQLEMRSVRKDVASVSTVVKSKKLMPHKYSKGSAEIEIYTCPNCDFSTRDYSLIDGHLYSCLDNLLP